MTVWQIKKSNHDLFLCTEIDSGGMAVYFMGQAFADKFHSEADAEQFVQRVKERYPTEEFEIVRNEQ